MSDKEIRELIQSEIDKRLPGLVQTRIDERFDNFSGEVLKKSEKSTILGVICIDAAILFVIFAVVICIFSSRRLSSKGYGEANDYASASDSIVDINSDGLFEVEANDDWEIFVYDCSDYFAASFVKNGDLGGTEEVFMSKSPEDEYVFLNCSTKSNDGAVVKEYKDTLSASDEERDGSGMFIIRIEGYDFPLSANQIELLRLYLTVKPLST